ncbi:hypothetical protein Nepgr_007313 [Nepenthes gracilis]|uniref:Protein kinase domain-containing protein n=1 Tax=Nepenthes gracilis TaxID=150966 RepID=A0AAD3XI66_NEPGR|nr:hypothetical protein Nepgr_007313 [Nepenthes gracilis]
MSRGEVAIAYAFTLAILSISFIILIIFLVFVYRRQLTQSDEALAPIKHCVQAYPFNGVDAATDRFHPRRVIRKGRLGTTYMAVLDSGELVAAKRIHPWLVLSSAGIGFSSRVKSLSFGQHPHVVSILGFSEAPGERIIIMEFVGAMNLDFYLHENVSLQLDWGRRLRIAAGVARGLEYLHEKRVPRVVHGCVKPSNVLIDVKFCARLCDYGLSFLAPQEKVGLVGYVDEEYWKESGGRGRDDGASKESDVFGFGVVVLELLTGRRSEEGLLIEWALPLIKERKLSEVLDPRVVIPKKLKPLARLAKVASACVANSRKSRPSISHITPILNDLEMELCLS